MAKPNYSWDQASDQLTRYLSPIYLPAGANGLTLTYAYRATATPPTVPPGASQWIGGLNSDMGGFLPFTASQIQVMERTLDMIEDIANIRLVRVGTGTTGTAAYSDQAELLLGNYTTGAATSYGGWGGYRFRVDNGVYTRAGKAWFDASEQNIANATSFNKAAFLFAHEVMHTLGVSHPGDYDVSDATFPTYEANAVFYEDSYEYTIMSYFAETATGANYGDNRPQTPMLYDIAALQAIYGANLTTRTGDTIYGFNSNTGYDAFTFTGPNARRIFSIWDAGGVDTLDMSGLAVGTTLNLNEEAFSSAGIRADGGMMINNISIARGAVIENAVGGRGNDTLIGNAVGNVLRGNQGNDILNGGNGSDTAAYAGTRAEYTITRNPDGSWSVTDSNAARDGADTLVSIEFLRFADQTFALLDDLPFPALFAANLSQGKAIAAAYQILLGGTPAIAGFEFLIKGNLSTNFGAGPGPVFNDENIFINVTNSLVQGNPTATAAFNTLAAGATLAEKITSLYTKIIPASKQSAEGIAFITRPDGLKFYQDVARERGITAENGPAVTALASLLKIAVDGKSGIGNPVSDLIAMIADGSAGLPAASQVVLPIETIDGTTFDADDAPDAMPGFSGPAPAPVPIIGVVELQLEPGGF